MGEEEGRRFTMQPGICSRRDAHYIRARRGCPQEAKCGDENDSDTVRRWEYLMGVAAHSPSSPRSSPHVCGWAQTITTLGKLLSSFITSPFFQRAGLDAGAGLSSALPHALLFARLSDFPADCRRGALSWPGVSVAWRTRLPMSSRITLTCRHQSIPVPFPL